jgi:3-hydroxyacyl-CoA dehydrogenase
MNAMPSHRVAMIGGGLMGAGIAQVFAVAGYSVTVLNPMMMCAIPFWSG